MTIVELPIISIASQQFTTVLSNRLCAFTVNYNTTNNRWSFDLAIENETVVQGRRIVLGADLIEPFNFGIGRLYAVNVGPVGTIPGRTELPSGLIRFIQVTDDV